MDARRVHWIVAKIDMMGKFGVVEKELPELFMKIIPTDVLCDWSQAV